LEEIGMMLKVFVALAGAGVGVVAVALQRERRIGAKARELEAVRLRYARPECVRELVDDDAGTARLLRDVIA
jgi:hypothetical protein